MANEIVKGHCPDCGPGRSADVVGHYCRKFDDEESGVWGQKDFRHTVTHYPAQLERQPPEWAVKLAMVDEQLRSLFADTYGALNAELRVPAAIAARTVFDRASELLNVDPAIYFSEKLDELATQVQRARIGALDVRLRQSRVLYARDGRDNHEQHEDADPKHSPASFNALRAVGAVVRRWGQRPAHGVVARGRKTSK